MLDDQSIAKKGSRITRCLAAIESIGNKLPDPAVLFIIFAILILVISTIGAKLGWQVTNPATGAVIQVVNLLTGNGIRQIVDNVLKNLANYGPLTSILLIMTGMGVAEGSGMINTLLVKCTSRLPEKLVVVTLIFIAISSNVASDSGFIVLPPLAALIFISMKRHPFIGIAATFACVAAGFNACIFLCTGDVLVAGMTEGAARIINPSITINPAVNYYFMAFSCVPLSLVGAWVTYKFIAPRYKDMSGIEITDEKLEELTPLQQKGLRNAGIAFLIVAGIIGLGIIPGGVLRNPETGGLIPSSFINGMVAIMTIAFLVPGVAYGRTVGSIKKDSDAVRMASNGVSSIAGAIVLAIVASQFISWFSWSNLGIFIAINGAEWMQSIGLNGIPLAIGIVLLCAVVNMFMGSQVAKWALLSTVLVPMLMLLGFHPALTQALYRIGDSVTNPASPLFQYFPVFVGFLRKYDKNAGIGTAMSLTLPYSISFLIVWIIMLVVWMLIGIPLGPEGYIWLS